MGSQQIRNHLEKGEPVDLQWVDAFNFYDRLYVISDTTLVSLTNGARYKSTPSRLLATLKRQGWTNGVVEGYWRFMYDKGAVYIDCFDENPGDLREIEPKEGIELPDAPNFRNLSAERATKKTSVQLGTNWKKLASGEKTRSELLVNMFQRSIGKGDVVEGKFSTYCYKRNHYSSSVRVVGFRDVKSQKKTATNK